MVSVATLRTDIAYSHLHQKIHPRILKYHIEGRVARINQEKNIDWATAEALAFGTLLAQGECIFENILQIMV
jgi:2-oxoglutarate dehydrogenase complex dehydrogenase (E1) component-like enzyme